MWDSSSRPSCARAATAAWMWGWSSRPPPLASGLALLIKLKHWSETGLKRGIDRSPAFLEVKSHKKKNHKTA